MNVDIGPGFGEHSTFSDLPEPVRFLRNINSDIKLLEQV